MLNRIYRHSIVRFLVVGFANLGVTYGVYLAAFYVLDDYRTAFWLSVGAALVFMSVANIHHTFLRRVRLFPALVYAAYYYAYSVVNLSAISYLIEVREVAEELAPIMTLVVLTPVHYVLSKYLIERMTRVRAKSGGLS